VAIGVAPSRVPELANVVAIEGIELAERSDSPRLPSDALVLLEPGRDVSDKQAAQLGEYVRQGGSLLVLLPKSPSVATMRLAFMLPTTAWKVLETRGMGGPIEATEFDHDFFGDSTAGAALALPYHLDIRPLHAVERGQARYERFAHTVQGTEWIKQPQKPGDTFWTRPLINRDATLRIRGNNQAADGLLVTG